MLKGPGTLAEVVEAEFMYRYVSMVGPPTDATLGITTARIGGGVALSVRNDVTGYWSKALGFGVTEPLTLDVIDRVVEFYREAHSPGAVIQIAPGALPPDWDRIRRHHDLRPGGHPPFVKLACRIDDFRPGASDLRIGRVEPESTREWASVTLRGFGMPEEHLTEMITAPVANGDFTAFAAWDGDEMVATANLFVRDEVGSLNSGATLPGHRNRGAQSALLAARAKEAARVGCRWLVAETRKPAAGLTNPSLNNMLRSGLNPLYERQNWLWSPVNGQGG